jgi:prepilin-type N-terminal cleavage/methylation domain-containing protein
MRFRISKFEFQMGFTLLEVVVGMAIVGLGVVTLLEIFSSGLRLGSKSSERTEAILYGRQVMDDALIRRDVIRGRDDGSFENRYRWTLRVDPIRDESVLDLSSGWELEEVTLEMGNLVHMKTIRLVAKER